jgi:hypothetical protein
MREVVNSDDLVDGNGALWTVALIKQIVLAPLRGAAARGVSAR